ncbi:uncharacterized protein MKK02DRAFT_41656 [Dioszegia hungarica]|uniref:Uncharacterized protein n=1 Tax=Dioszegia hungarica TaxID=4972 RepID=A0AA38H364_9TREE|nr:uncharacterized protein MKK02DRAFT_41656 [Dioszegia hungarica]KAI9632014.1 hypothetical protein MKK02DRAFT_41656 [Dioszegia hungarica]
MRRPGSRPRYLPPPSGNCSYSSRLSDPWEDWEDGSAATSDQNSLAGSGASVNILTPRNSKDASVYDSTQEGEFRGDKWSSGINTPAEHSDDTGSDSIYTGAPATRISVEEHRKSVIQSSQFPLGTAVLATAAVASLAALSLYGNTAYPTSLAPSVATTFRDGLFNDTHTSLPYPSNASILGDTLVPLAHSTWNAASAAISASPTWAKCTAAAGAAYLARDIPARMSHELHNTELGHWIGRATRAENLAANIHRLVKPDPEPKPSWWSWR